MNKDISLSKAAIIAGIGLLIMTLTVPFAEFKIIPDLVSPDSASETAANITNNIFLGTLRICKARKEKYIITNSLVSIAIHWGISCSRN